MNKLVLLAVLAVVSCFILLPTTSAEAPKAEVFGGYQFTRVNFEGSGASFNGWNASLTGNVNDWFGVTGDFSGAYKSESGASVKIYTYAFGPTVSLNHEGTVNPFVHALFGGAHLSASLQGSGGGVNGFTMMMGGGVDAKVSPRLAVRVVQADWVYYRFEGVSESKNVRISTGLVFRF